MLKPVTEVEAARTSTMDTGMNADEILPYSRHPMDNQPPPFPPHPRNWWQRNWPWAAPTGCLSLLLLLALFAGGIITVVMSAMKSSDAYKNAIQRARTNEQVTNALGTPLTEGWLVSGNINVTTDSGNANLSIPIAGPRGKATIYVIATKSEGVWVYSRMDARVNGTGQRIDLLASSHW